MGWLRGHIKNRVQTEAEADLAQESAHAPDMMHRFTPAFFLSTFLVALAALQSVSATPLPEAGALVERACESRIFRPDEPLQAH